MQCSTLKSVTFVQDVRSCMY